MTLRLGDGSLVVTDTQSYSDEPSTAYLQRRQRAWGTGRGENEEKITRRGNKILQTAATILVSG